MMAGVIKATVELNLFSGFPNPLWEIADLHEAEALRQSILAIPQERADFVAKPPYSEPLGRPRSGYRGFDLTFTTRDGVEEFEAFEGLVLDLQTTRVRSRSTFDLEKRVFATLPKQLVAEFLEGMTYEEVTAQGQEGVIKGIKGVPAELKCDGGLPYLGDTGDFQTFRSRNNCYNYATNVVNKVIGRRAIPGSPNVRSPLNLEKLAGALDHDLESLGPTLPGECPPEDSHYIAVVLRFHPTGRIRDFHCLRLDSDGRWSHKDGKGEVRNVDDKGDVIKDLRAANLSWSPELVGFYRMSAASRPKIK